MCPRDLSLFFRMMPEIIWNFREVIKLFDLLRIRKVSEYLSLSI
ncbi:Uncharacterized protein dnm_060560 [Desulfonema magnum]|uniref:Uncharacterized protein n=1 Tax=Desulfonema magnum TaxID=45655 RepID=A0A975GQF8_9BACT|nr:Uncharacterized protein dnm_060560 [Desulfonema magnum]